jgi:hypothetical protein
MKKVILAGALAAVSVAAYLPAAEAHTSSSISVVATCC